MGSLCLITTMSVEAHVSITGELNLGKLQNMKVSLDSSTEEHYDFVLGNRAGGSVNASLQIASLIKASAQCKMVDHKIDKNLQTCSVNGITLTEHKDPIPPSYARWSTQVSTVTLPASSVRINRQSGPSVAGVRKSLPYNLTIKGSGARALILTGISSKKTAIVRSSSFQGRSGLMLVLVDQNLNCSMRAAGSQDAQCHINLDPISGAWDQGVNLNLYGTSASGEELAAEIVHQARKSQGTVLKVDYQNDLRSWKSNYGVVLSELNISTNEDQSPSLRVNYIYTEQASKAVWERLSLDPNVQVSTGRRMYSVWNQAEQKYLMFSSRHQALVDGSTGDSCIKSESPLIKLRCDLVENFADIFLQQ